VQVLNEDAPRVKDARDAEGSEPFVAALRAIQGAWPSYVRLNALSEAAPDFRDPEAFVRSLSANVFADAALWPAERVTAFFAWAEAQEPVNKLALVLAALHALDRGEAVRAESRARRVHALAPNDLHIQELLRRATGRPDPDLTGRFCRAPFEGIETAPDGNVFFCCPAWLPVPIGRLAGGSAEAVWNSPAAREIRRSIHDGDFRYCSRTHCPHLSSKGLPLAAEVRNRDLRPLIEARTTELEHGPRKLVLSHDRSCNLSCPSCRTSTILARKPEQKRLNAVADEVILPMARDAERVHVTASGDPFGSAHFRYVLGRMTREAFPHLRLDIQTNGVLFDRVAWEVLDLRGRIDKVSVSMDAATEATYAVVRRGGDFRRLLDNLEFLAKMRRAGEFRTLRLDFVVQALNFREMPAFVRLAESFGFDGVKFQMIRNWNTFTPAEYRKHDIGSPEHPGYADFLAILRDLTLGAGPSRFGAWAPRCRTRQGLRRPRGSE
jgi:pyruvate-formate lyase-activating enzyme